MANSTAGDMVKAEVLEGLGTSANLIFENAFDLYGMLDLDGHILDLKGKIFNETNAEPHRQIAQRFPDTIFWQSSENTPKLLERAISTAVDIGTSQLAIDFRVSADEKRPLEVIFQRVGDFIFVCGRRIYLSGGLPTCGRKANIICSPQRMRTLGFGFGTIRKTDLIRHRVATSYSTFLRMRS